MRLPFDQSAIRLKRRWLLGLACLGAVAALCAAWRLQQHIVEQFESARARDSRPHLVPFERQRRDRSGGNEVALIQSTRHIKALAHFKESYFAATDGGLIEMSPAGEVVKHYSVLDGLPESELLALAVFNGRLYIGTGTQGLVEFDGERFTRFRWTDRTAQAVTALLANPGRLLIGTFAGGLLAFDGKQFSELKAEAGKQRLRAINCLVQAGPRLFVGTFDNGLWLEAAGRWLHFTTAAGLPSNRVTGIVADNGRIFVATDFGLAVANAEELFAGGAGGAPPKFQTLALLPSLSSLARYQDRLLACKDDGGLFQVSLLAGKTSRETIKELDWNRPPTLSDCRLAALNQSLWLMGSEGLWRNKDDSAATNARLTLTPFSRADGAQNLSNNIVSALAFDGAGRLWVGSFRNGIDVFNPAGQRLTHLESDTLREINHLRWDAQAKQMLAATASGLFIFDSALLPQRVTRAEGLLSNAVSHVALMPVKTTAKYQNALLLATNRGLSLGELGKLRALTTAQGLPSNNLYAALPVGERVYAGTLAGLAEIEAGRVVRVFKDSNSKLTHNWVTSLCADGRRLFIGTYGGGIFELTAAGDLFSFAGEIGRVVVNPNALFSDGARLYAGTLDGARVLELRSQRWIYLKSQLPALTVLSITGDGRQVYFGTTHGIARVAVGYRQALAQE
jgi:ligand-binding sensor domain-containing protein